jgi:hypothetical protein
MYLIGALLIYPHAASLWGISIAARDAAAAAARERGRRRRVVSARSSNFITLYCSAMILVGFWRARILCKRKGMAAALLQWMGCKEVKMV